MLFNLGQYNDAENKIIKAMEAENVFPSAYLTYAAILYKTNRIKQAIKQIEISINQSPRTCANAHHMLSVIRCSQGDFDRAEQHIRRAKRIKSRLKEDIPYDYLLTEWYIRNKSSQLPITYYY